jgi:hypothetical protein
MFPKPLHLWSVLALFSFAPFARAQCLRWENDFRQPATDNGVFCLLPYDDGRGPALFAGGTFQTAGGVTVKGIGRWDGKSWSSLGSGVHNQFASPVGVQVMLPFDDGTGTVLYAGGGFDHAGGVLADGLARWNGTSWSNAGIAFGGSVHQLVAFDDGSGLALYAGGYFTAGGLPPGTNNIVRWNGELWSAVGSGAPFGIVYDMVVHDDGTGPALYDTRSQYSSATTTTNSISRWNGSAWIPIASNFGQVAIIGSLCSFDDGGGARLYAAGQFHAVDGVSVPGGVARWDGSRWSDASSGLALDDPDATLSVADDGSGPKLYLTTGSSVAGIKVWNGAGWSGALPGLTPSRLATWNDGTGNAIYGCGDFQPAASSPLSALARWNGSAWTALGDPSKTHGVNKTVYSIATFDDGGGAKLYAIGDFTLAGSTYIGTGAARFDGTTWSAIEGFEDNEVLRVLDFGTGPRLVSASVALYAWNGTAWDTLPSSYCYPYDIAAIASCDLGAGPSIYAGGNMAAANGHQLNSIARFNGSDWEALGSGVGGTIHALEPFDTGTGLALYVGGAFNTAGGISAQNIARWNGTSWSSLGNLNNHVYALRVFDDGSGPSLFVGGGFTTAGGVAATGVARWNGSSFSPAGSGLNGVVRAFEVFDDGSGAALYACGDFIDSAGDSIPRIAKWTGSSWLSLGSGVDGRIYSMAVFDDGTGPALFAGGTFAKAGVEPSVNLAKWSACTASIESMCFGDGSLRPCPCSNQGIAGHGCENSSSTGGARMVANGATSPDTLGLHVTGELPNALSIFLQGNQWISSGVRFGDGVRCAGGSLLRLFVKSASLGAVMAPGAGDPSISARSAELGDAIAPGSARYYLAYYRDPSLAFCPAPQGDAWNATNGVRVVW